MPPWPQDAPRCSQVLPRCSQDAPKMFPRCSPDAPRCSQDAPRCSQAGLLRCQDDTDRIKLPGSARITRYQDYAARITQPGLRNQDCATRITQPGLRYQDYAAKITLPGLRSHVPRDGTVAFPIPGGWPSATTRAFYLDFKP